MITDVLSNKKCNPTVTELFTRGRDVKHFSCFYHTILFAVPKNIRLNYTYYFSIKIPNKSELEQIAFNHLRY